ncbi:MAG TPA: DinB family protein [Candidatus Sulfotelmatobacter sp.]|nr:DinB family protein [Candidatus Sulfotelmatobacter sp.]
MSAMSGAPPIVSTVVPRLALLERTPDIVAALVSDLDDASVSWKPSPDRWCVQEVVGHLADIEPRGFRGRVEMILAQDRPTVPAVDPEQLAAGGRYLLRSLADWLADFRRERALSLEVLRGVLAEDLDRPAVHGGLGPFKLSDLLHEWPLHDLGHTRQIAELMRAQLHPHIGPWREMYKVNP